MALTAKQQQVFDFVVAYVNTHNFPPTYGEIGGCLNIARGTVLNHLKALEARGILSWNPNEARSIKLKGATSAYH